MSLEEELKARQAALPGSSLAISEQQASVFM